MSDSRRKEENQSLIGVDLHGDAAVKRTEHRDGSVEEDPLNTDAFADMDERDRPHDLPEARTGALTEDHHHGLTRAEHIDRSCRVEAALIKTMPHTDRVVSDSDCRKILKEVLLAMGGEYSVEATKL